jgi:hypothetical protein
MDDFNWVKMRFGSQQIVNVADLILVMQGDPLMKLTDDQWEQAKEHCAEVMGEFLLLRREAAGLESNLHFYVTRHNELERHFLQTHGFAEYKAFRKEMDEQRAEDARKNKPASKPAWKSHMWIKGNK